MTDTTPDGGRPTRLESAWNEYDEDIEFGIAAHRNGKFERAQEWRVKARAARAEVEAAAAEAENATLRERVAELEGAAAHPDEDAQELAGLREQVAAQDRELSALSSDKQTLMTAVTHWREQVEGLRAALLSAATEAQNIAHSGFTAETWALIRANLSPWPAATRPVPAHREIDGGVPRW